MESGEASEVKTFSLTRGVQVLKAGAKLGQAQLQQELDFTLLKFCCITLMITDYQLPLHILSARFTIVGQSD